MEKKANDLMTFGERLAYARKEKGLNQKQLGALIGATQSIISRWEKGVHKPDMSMVRKIIKTLEVSEDWLIGNNNFKMNWQDIRLTKEQQQYVADREWLISYMYNKKFRFLKAPYDFYYGYAAIGLCKAAIVYDENKGSFFALAYLRIKSEITHAYESERKDVWTRLSLNNLVSEDDDTEFGSIIPAPDEWEAIEYKVLVGSVYQKVEPALRDEEKEPFKLCLYGKTNKEISKILGIKYDTAKERTESAKKKCRDLFNPDEMFS